MKKISLALVGISLASLGHAQSRFICQLTSIKSATAVAVKYKILLLDVAYGPFALYEIPGGGDGDTVRTQMRADTQIVWAEDDEDISTAETQKGSTIAAIVDRNALYKENKNALAQVHFDSRLALKPGRKVRVAILDTGLSPNLPSLWNKVVDSCNLVEVGKPAFDVPHGTDSNHNGFVDEATGHGSMVAGIIDQIAPLAPLVVIRIADSDGNSNAWSIIKGISRAVAVKAEVANISLGSSTEIPALSDVLDWAKNNNLTVCSPIGNDNQLTARYPARIDTVISVAGVDPLNSKASFSNWWPSTTCSAPATGIKSYYWNGHMGIWSGTSFSSPFVAAVIADGLRKTGYLSSEQIKSAVQSAGDPLNALNPKFPNMLGTLLDMGKLEQAIINAYKGRP